MSCSDESIWCKFKFNRFTLFCFIILLGKLSSFGQNGGTWQLKMDADHYISIRKAWSSSESQASILVMDSVGERLFGLSFIALEDEWNHFNFPDDFVSYTDDQTIPPQILFFMIKEKKNVYLNKPFFYDPSPNTLLQLRHRSLKEKVDSKLVWGNLIDAYEWEDKIGKNVVFRSELIHPTMQLDSTFLYSKYLYFYHFLEEETGLKLVRKFTDVQSDCSSIPGASFDMITLELTDIDRDTIGEISTFYSLYCAAEDINNFETKVLLSTAGKKFIVRGNIDPCASASENRVVSISSSPEVKQYEYFKRFLEQKLKQYYQAN